MLRIIFQIFRKIIKLKAPVEYVWSESRRKVAHEMVERYLAHRYSAGHCSVVHPINLTSAMEYVGTGLAASPATKRYGKL